MSRRVLVVDDDHDHAESLADILELRGHTVALAHSCDEALSRFSQADFELVLLDVQFPGMNGVQTFFEFKKRRQNARVLMMTGYSVEQLVMQTVGNGAIGILRRPFSAAALLAAMEKANPHGMVLIIDPDPLFVDSIAELLEMRGYRPFVASSAAEVLQKLAREPINWLLLDQSLPVLSGLEIHVHLKEAGRPIPIIFAPAQQWNGREQGGQWRRGCPISEGLLVKPFDPEILLRVVSRNA